MLSQTSVRRKVIPMKAATERDQVVLSMLMEHHLHDGLTAEGAFNYLLGRTHVDRRKDSWRRSPRALAFWMKKKGFSVVRNSQMNRYFWGTKRVDAHGKRTFDKGKPLGMLA